MINNPGAPSSSRRALVCDADEISVRYSTRILRDTGFFSITSCGTAADCERLAALDPPDLFVIALILPDRDGLALVRRLRAHPSEVSNRPIIMLSVLQAEARAREAGTDVFLLKPASKEIFLDAIDRVLGPTRREVCA